MVRLFDSINALERLQQELDLAIDEMHQAGITKINYLDAKIPKSRDSKNYVYVDVYSREFPFYAANFCGTGEVKADFHIRYGLHADFDHFSASTSLYNHERDRLLSTPLKIRKKAIKDFEEEVKAEINRKYIALGAILNVRNSLEKLKKSVDGLNPVMKIYKYIPESEESGKYFKIRKSLSKEASLTELQKLFKHYIDLAKDEVEGLGVKRCTNVSIGYDNDVGPVSLITTPSFFPFVFTTGVGGQTITYYGFEKLGAEAWLDNIHVFTDVPFRKRNLFFKLNSELKKQLLNRLKRHMEWFRSIPFKKQQEVYQKYPKIRQTQEFYGQLQKEVFEL